MSRLILLSSILSISVALAAIPDGDTITNSIGMKFKRIPAGTFTMGRINDFVPASPEEWRSRGDWDETPAHSVTISNDFFMGIYEVTLAQFRKSKPGFSSGDTLLPVRSITWTEADSFCLWLTENDAFGYTYRLPTEAEWEYACRAGTVTKFYTGDTIVDSQANMGRTKDGSAALSAPVHPGSYAPNAWGLYDMHGNVLEWCSDWFGPYESYNQTDPVGRISGDAKVVRGGAFKQPLGAYNNLRFCRSENRSGMVANDAANIVGFRVVIGKSHVSTPLPVIQDAIYQRDVSQTHSPWTPIDTPFFRYDDTHLIMKKGEWGPLYTWQNHVPNITFCPNGDILAIHYTEVAEGSRESNAVLSRLRRGNMEWDSVSLFLTIPDVGLGANAIYTDRQGVIWHFVTLALDGWRGGLAFRTSTDNGVSWTKLKMINRGTWTTACSVFESNDGVMLFLVVHNDTDSKLWITEDRGQTWRLSSGSLKGIRAATVMLDDGRLVGFGRYSFNGYMPKSVSTDTGRTFTHYTTPFPPISIASSPTLVKLSNGGIVLGSHDNAGWGIIPTSENPRYFVALSYDGGETWPHVRATGFIGQAAAAIAPNDLMIYYGTRVTLSAEISSGGDALFNEKWLKQGPPVPGTSTGVSEFNKDRLSSAIYVTPNPFNLSTVIHYSLDEITNARYIIYSVKGEVVRIFDLSNQNGSLVWDGRDCQGHTVQSGCFVGRFSSSNGKTMEHRLLFLK
ncbi:MAG: SUMF1/EgtB/PvdO family nonheme iron enzyme [Fibrobacteres bacterium]|nr:SUMF1/EgtB/PvdO family nonheme iron enzyme [Fibrobacterota bacterium]